MLHFRSPVHLLRFATARVLKHLGRSRVLAFTTNHIRLTTATNFKDDDAGSLAEPRRNLPVVTSRVPPTLWILRLTEQSTTISCLLVKMGQPSYQASNAIIYLTYGAFLWDKSHLLILLWG